MGVIENRALHVLLVVVVEHVPVIDARTEKTTKLVVTEVTVLSRAVHAVHCHHRGTTTVGCHGRVSV